jgi:hypothetical protein
MHGGATLDQPSDPRPSSVRVFGKSGGTYTTYIVGVGMVWDSGKVGCLTTVRNRFPLSASWSNAGKAFFFFSFSQVRVPWPHEP